MINSLSLTTGGPSAEEARAIRDAVANATTLDEVERLNQMLKAGIVPGKQNQSANGSKSNGTLTHSLHHCLNISFSTTTNSCINLINTTTLSYLSKVKTWKKKMMTMSLWTAER